MDTNSPRKIQQKNKIKLSWNNLTITKSLNKSKNYSKIIPIEKNTKKILDNISGHIQSGEALAIIGSSGAGKTTLLNLLSKTQKNKNLEYKGEIFINNLIATNEIIENISAYVKQDDILEASMTPKEILLFTAKLKLANLSDEEIEKKVDYMINKLNINNAKDTRVGNELIKGISGGERKRTSIALELIGDPEIIFLDEPTTGLDSFNAFEVVKNITELAKKDNKLVIFTIHNPQSEVFGLLDKLCILADGKTIFFGDTKDSLNCFDDIFEFPCPKNYNPFEHFIEVTSLDSEFLEKNFNKNIKELKENDIIEENENDFTKFEYDNIEAYSGFMDLLAEKFEKNKGKYLNTQEDLNDFSEINEIIERKNKIIRGFFYEFSILFSRNIISSFRKKKVLAVKLIQNFISSILQAVLFNSFSNNITGIRDRTGLIFLCIKACIFGTANSTLFVFAEQKKIYDRERSNRLYSILAYYLAKLFSEIPIIIMGVNCLLTLTYLVSDFNDTFSWKYYLFNLISQLIAVCGLSYSIFFGSLISNLEILGMLNILFLYPQMILSGYFSSSENVTIFMKPLEIISSFKYAFQALTEVEFMEMQPLNCLNNININENECDALNGIFKFKENLSDNLFAMMLIIVTYLTLAFFVLVLNEMRRRK